MDFKQKPNDASDHQKLEEIYAKLSSMSRQLTFLQGFMESKFGPEYATFCHMSEQTPSTSALDDPYACGSELSEGRSVNDDGEDYDKMPNLVSQESPSRTLGFVTVPLRQASGTIDGAHSSHSHHSHKMHSGHLQSASDDSSKHERAVIVKGEGGLQPGTVVGDDLMYPLHNFTDLLAENTGPGDGAAATPEFMEMELDPSQLLRGEPPALQPIYSDNNQHGNFEGVNNLANQTYRRGGSRSGAVMYKYEMEVNNGPSTSNGRGASMGQRRASAGGHENNHSTSSEGQPGMIDNDDDDDDDESAIPLPRLLPRPVIPLVSPEKILPNHVDQVTANTPRSKKTHPPQQSSSSSSSSAGGGSSRASSASKKRTRYNNQSRPCSLECPECGLKIRDKSRLTEHLRGHTGERPFRCTYCDKTYTRKDVLKTHMIKMHGEAPQDQDQDHGSSGASLDMNMYRTCE